MPVQSHWNAGPPTARFTSGTPEHTSSLLPIAASMQRVLPIICTEQVCTKQEEERLRGRRGKVGREMVGVGNGGEMEKGAAEGRKGGGTGFEPVVQVRI